MLRTRIETDNTTQATEMSVYQNDVRTGTITMITPTSYVVTTMQGTQTFTGTLYHVINYVSTTRISE